MNIVARGQRQVRRMGVEAGALPLKMGAHCRTVKQNPYRVREQSSYRLTGCGRTFCLYPHDPCPGQGRSTLPNRWFRKETLGARKRDWLGSLIVAAPLSRGLLTLLALVWAASMRIFLFFGHHMHREAVIGQRVTRPGHSMLLHLTPARPCAWARGWGTKRRMAKLQPDGIEGVLMWLCGRGMAVADVHRADLSEMRRLAPRESRLETLAGYVRELE